MEKHLVLFLIAVIGYIIWKCLTETTEGFADAQTVDGVDDNNAINTLAKIAKDLQEGGGLKIMGKLNLADTHVFSSDNGWLRLKNKDQTQHTNMAVKDLLAEGSLTSNSLTTQSLTTQSLTTSNMAVKDGFKGQLFGDSSIGSTIGLYHPNAPNQSKLLSISASESDISKPYWNQVNIKADDLQFRNANGASTIVTTNGTHKVTDRLTIKNRDILNELDALNRGSINKRNILSELDELNKLKTRNILNELDELNKLKNRNILTELDELNKLKNQNILTKLDELTQIQKYIVTIMRLLVQK